MEKMITPGMTTSKRVEHYQKKEEKERRKRKLAEQLRDISEELNVACQEQYGISLVGIDGAIDMEEYSRNTKMDQEKLNEDKEKIRNQEISNSGLDKEGVRDFYAEKHNAKSLEEMLEIYKKNRAQSKSGLLEVAVMSIFHKLLKEDFVVVRASLYDDYFNRVDTVIVNKKTGNTICAFDEVAEGEEGQRYKEKVKKTQDKTINGGAKLRYGFTFKNGKIIQKEVENLPVFFIGVNGDEWDNLLGGMSLSAKERMGELELNYIRKIVSSLEKQRDSVRGMRLPLAISENLKKFDKVLEQIKKTIEEYGNCDKKEAEPDRNGFAIRSA